MLIEIGIRAKMCERILAKFCREKWGKYIAFVNNVSDYQVYSKQNLNFRETR